MFSFFLQFSYNHTKNTKGTTSMIKCDCHLHTALSTDGLSDMEEMILSGIEKGLSFLCFTEHMDYGAAFEEGPDAFQVDTAAYHSVYYDMKEKYSRKIRLLFGIELGLQPSIGGLVHDYVASFPFDFVIGSSHTAGGIDPYYPAFFEGRTEEEACRFYFETELACAKTIPDFDVYGHLDYVLRYGPSQNRNFTYERYQDLLDPLLLTLIADGKGIECNTSGFKYGMGHPLPHTDILKRYHALGGDIITIGSDAHEAAHIAHSFSRAREVLLSCGFRHYVVFEERKPSFYPL